ncbi:centrosomal protein of 126 kDa [Phaenicophaeus curvirostris]|uniref:centrosomal protein of 126 kDa n=1 Tax=Phaenicophaeus curvirostris TaxID=33595 RepID=UPI0037F0C2D2
MLSEGVVWDSETGWCKGSSARWLYGLLRGDIELLFVIVPSAALPPPPQPRPRPVAKEAASLVAKAAERSAPGALNGAQRDKELTSHFEWDLEEERRALKENQKICRSRAQKYLIETNRRRKAFEERRKQEAEKEQRFRNQVLQQRKIKLQEITDKFQRAPLPFSQHKKIVQTKAAFQLEEALKQIKGSVLTPGLCLPSRNKANFRTTDDTSSSPASRNGSFHQKQISAVASWDKTTQEVIRTNMDSKQLFQKNLKEMQQLLEKHHLSNLENFHQEVKKTDDSESLSSFDSLEAGEQNGNCTTQSESSLTTECDCALYRPEKSQTTNNGLFYTAQITSSKNMHLNNCLRNADSRNNNLPIHELLAKHNVLTPAEHVNNSEEESSASCRSGKKPAEFSTSNKQESSVSKAFGFLQNIKERSKPPSGLANTLATGHPVFNPSKAWASPDSVPGGRIHDLVQDQSFQMTPQKRTLSVQTSSQPIATSAILFPNQGCSTGIPSTADMLQKKKNISTEFSKNTLGKMPETKEENIECIDDINSGSSLFQDVPNAPVLCDVKQQNNREEEKGNKVETVSLLSDTELNSGTPAHYKTLKNNTLERKRLFISILKKESKYEPSHFKDVVMNHGISFGTRPLSSIRDSVELAKMKKKSAESEKYNRKIRWCDQINQIIVENNNKCYEKNTSEISSAQLQYVQTTNNAPKTNLSIVAQHSNPMFIKNHQENCHISKPNVKTKELNEECTSQNIFLPTGSFSTTKAWMVSQDEESKPSICGNNSKIKEVKAKITRRPISLRARPSFMPEKRTGTTLRLRSASEADKTLKAPGKLLAPHPPSVTLLGNRSGENTASPGYQPLLPSTQQATSRNDFNERHVLLADQVLNRNGTENSERITFSSGLATAVPPPGCHAAKCESLVKNTCSANSIRASACQDCPVTCAERRPPNAENGLHLYPIPAAAKTRTSWQGAHTARAPKDSATVSESIAQFLLAEKLASMPVAEDEILAAMESVQPARQPLVPNRAPCLGMSALSVEEKKILQSLDHLNQRLQNVREAISRNPSASKILQIISPPSIQQCMASPLVNTTIASQQYQNASSGSNRLQLYRKY